MTNKRRQPEQIREDAARMLKIDVSEISESDAEKYINANSLKLNDVELS